MKHKWDKLPDHCKNGVGYFKVWKCRVCGCIKELLNQRFAEADYERNGQIYSHYIECIDEEAEKLKTID